MTGGRAGHGTKPALSNVVQKLVLASILIATFVVPGSLAGSAGSAQYRAVLTRMGACIAVYVFLLLFVYPRLF